MVAAVNAAHRRLAFSSILLAACRLDPRGGWIGELTDEDGVTHELALSVHGHPRDQGDHVVWYTADGSVPGLELQLLPSRYLAACVADGCAGPALLHEDLLSLGLDPRALRQTEAGSLRAMLGFEGGEAGDVGPGDMFGFAVDPVEQDHLEGEFVTVRSGVWGIMTGPIELWRE